MKYGLVWFVANLMLTVGLEKNGFDAMHAIFVCCSILAEP